VPARVPEAEAVADMRAAGLFPLEPYPGALAPWLCACTSCGNEVAPSLESVRRGHGCRFCAPNAPIAAESAVSQMRAAGLEPLTPFPGVVVPWRSRCMTCNNEVFPRLQVIRRGQGGCPYCAGNAPIGVAEAESQMRAAGLEPLEPYPGGVLKPWRCRCLTCERESTTSLANVRHSGGGCQYCTGWAHRG
jgi:hypothetical protein